MTWRLVYILAITLDPRSRQRRLETSTAFGTEFCSRVIPPRRLTSPLTQYRLSGRRFYRSKDPTNSIKVLKEILGQPPEEDPIPPGASHRVTSEPLKKEKPYHSGSSPARQSPTQHYSYNKQMTLNFDPEHLKLGMWRSQPNLRWMRISCSKSVGFGFVVRSKLPAILAIAIQLSYYN